MALSQSAMSGGGATNNGNDGYNGAAGDGHVPATQLAGGGDGAIVDGAGTRWCAAAAATRCGDVGGSGWRRAVVLCAVLALVVAAGVDVCARVRQTPPRLLPPRWW